MVNEIINGISTAINAAFGEAYRIYIDDVEQGLVAPCFFIVLLETARQQRLGPRYRLTVPVDVQYLPQTVGGNSEMTEAAQRLFDVLQVITLSGGDGVRGAEARFEIADGVLHFFVHYSVFLRRLVELPLMEELEATTGIEKG